MKLIYKTLLVVIALVIYSGASADWKISTGDRSINKDAEKVATVINQAGHLFSVYRMPGNDQVWGAFSLAENTSDQIDSERPPSYRVDEGTEYDLSESKNLDELYGLNMYQWKPGRVDFVIWHGKVDEGVSGDIVNMIKGNDIHFRYYLEAGGYNDTSFTLTGSSFAISEIVGIDLNKTIDHQKNKM